MDNSRKLHPIIEILIFISFAALVAFLIWSWKFAGAKSDSISFERTELEGEWARELDDGSLVSFSMPGEANVEAGEHLVLLYKIQDNVLDGDYIATRAVHMNMIFYVDDELRYQSIQDETSAPYRKDIASRYVYVPVNSSDIGKTLRVECYRNSPGVLRFKNWYVGEKISHLTNYIQEFSLQMLIGMAFAIIGAACVLLGIAIRILTKGDLRLDFIGLAMCTLAIWNLTQSDFRDFLFVNVKAISIVPTLALLILSFSMGLFFNAVQKERYTKSYFIALMVGIVFGLVRLALQILHISDIYEGLPFVLAYMYSMVLFISVTVIIDKKKKYLSEYRIIAIGFVAVALSGVVQAISYFSGKDENTPIILSLGFFILTIVSFVQVIQMFIQNNLDRKRAEVEAETKARFWANISHEIKNPINAILGINEMIYQESREGKIRDYSKDLESAGNMLMGLLNDVLDISRIDSGKMTLVSGAYNVKNIIRDCYQLIEKRAKDKGLLLIVESSPRIPKLLYGDDIRIKQIILNLLTNAVKYTDGGRVTLVVEGEDIDPYYYNLRVRVIDTGMGISKENQKKLFAAYERIDIKNKNIDGTGLGLAITAELVGLMNGTITVDSTPGVGSEFVINIPQKILDKDVMGDVWEEEVLPKSKNESKYEGPLFKAPNARILIVDDVPLNLKVCEGLLRDTEIIVDTATNGDECIFKALSCKYDLILLDQQMPDKTGVETLIELQNRDDNLNKNTPFIMLTAATEEEGIEYEKIGFASYLAKPFSISQLQNIVFRYIPKDKIDEETKK